MRGPLVLICISLFASSIVSAQLRYLSIDQRIDGASIIVEGRVVASTPFLSDEGTMIYTAHRIEIDKALKLGRARAALLREIELITPGGRVDDRWHVVHPSLSLAPGDAGMFFVDIRRHHAGRTKAFVPHASALGFVKYRRDGSAFDPFEEYPDIAASLYDRVRDRTGQSYIEIRPSSPQATGGGGGGAGPSITGLSPGTVRAGIQDVLTIDGSGFGTLTGAAAVLFDDSIDGMGGSFDVADPEHIVSWTDTQIQVYVPNLTGGKVTAGTGKVIVRDAAGLETTSPGDLTVEYALNEVLSFGVVNRLRHIDQNAMGGYTLKYSTSTANGGVDFTTIPDAMARFDDALESWRCATGWNVVLDGTTTAAAAGDDGVNIVAFDNDLDPLPTNVLGRSTSFFQGCTGDTWRVIGMDIRFRRDGTGGADWYFGSNPSGQSPGEDDFETVALHELGHNLQHDHVNDPNDPMYFSISVGANKRALSTADVNGGLEIVGLSSGFVACNTTGMLTFDCSAPPTTEFLGSPLGGCGTSLTVDFSDMSQNGPTAWSWDFGDAAASSARHPSHTYSSQGIFTVMLDASNANGSDMEMKTDYVIVTDAPLAASCSPTFTGHNNCCGIGIKNVTLHSIDKSTGTPKDGDPLEEDFTCSDISELQASTSYPISVTTGSGNNEDVKVYIDWDDDGILESGELAFSSDNTQPLHTGSISVPATAVRDTALRMRVLSDFASNNINSPCENIEYGQVENYSVIVAADAPAGAPGMVPDASLTLTKNANPALVDLSWSASCGAGASDYTIHEGALGSFYSHSSVVCTTGGATSFSGLSPAAGDRYFVVAPASATDEGSYGVDSSAAERPVSSTTCIAAQDTSACP